MMYIINNWINTLIEIYKNKKTPAQIWVNCTIKHLNSVKICAVTMTFYWIPMKLELFIFDWLFTSILFSAEGIPNPLPRVFVIIRIPRKHLASAILGGILF